VDGIVVTITLTVDSANDVRALTGLATNDANTFLVVEPIAAMDVDDNKVNRIGGASALGVTQYGADVVPPQATRFEIDLTAETLTIHYEQPVDGLSINVSQITLQTNDVRALTGLATNDANTFLVVEPIAAMDVDDNKVNRIGGASALGVTQYGADVVPPQATRFEIDLTAETLTIHYEQPVDGLSINVSQITLQNLAANATSSRTLTGGQLSSTVATSAVIGLTTDDLNEIKRQPLCANVDHPEDVCFLSFGSTSVVDATGLAVPAVSKQSAIRIIDSDYTADTVAPELITRGFDSIDLNTGEITLIFTETVDRLSVDGTQITLQSYAESPDFTFTLDTVNVISTVDSTSVTFRTQTSDLNAIKINRNLCTVRSNCYVSYNLGAIADMAGNLIEPSVPTSDNALLAYAQTVTVHETRPSLVSYSMDMNSNRLVLTFDESVLVSSLQPQFITLQSTNISSDVSHSLTFLSFS
jgi:hypothetical protein